MTTSRSTLGLGVCTAAAILVAAAPAQTRSSDSIAQAGDDPKPITLSPFEVSTDRDTTYRANNAVSGDRSNSALRDIPQSIFVLTDQFMKDLEITDYQEAMAFVPGVSLGPAQTDGNNAVGMRGLPGGSLMSGNMPDDNTNFLADSTNVERMEIMQGASSSLYGASSPAGVVNRITKAPKDRPLYEASLQFGSFNFVRGMIDLTGPVNRSKSLLYRIVAADESADSFRDYVHSNRWSVYPSVTYVFKPGTHVTASFEFIHSFQVNDSGLPIIGNNPLPTLPINRFLGGPDLGTAANKRNSRLNFDHRFNENWSLRVGYVFTDTNTDTQVITTSGRVNEVTRLFARVFSMSRRDISNHTVQVDLLGEFKTGPISHRSLFGSDVRSNSSEVQNFSRTVTPSMINVDNPILVPTSLGNPNPTAFTTIRSDLQGAYWQNNASVFNRRLQLVTGARVDAVEQESATLANRTPNTFRAPNVMTPRIALLVRPFLKDVTVYAAYSESFRPNTSGSPIWGTDEKLKPATGLVYDTGIKAGFLDGRLYLDVNVYHTVNANIVEADPLHPGFSIQTAKQESNGGTFSFNADPIKGMTLFGGYSYIDARNTVIRNLALLDTQLPNAPRHSGSIFVKYRVQSGPFRALGLGVGMRRVGVTHGPSNTNIEMPPYSVVTVQTDYTWRKYTFNIAVNNVFDTVYWPRPNAFGGNRAGEPLSFRSSVRTRF